MKRKKKRKIPIELRMDPDLLKWLEDKVREGTFESVSDGIRKCVKMAMKQPSKST